MGAGFVAVNLAPDLVVNLEIFFYRVPRLLRNHQQADSELRHYRHRLGRDGGSVSAALERARRARTDLAARLAGEFAAFHVAVFERVQNQLSVFDEQVAAFVLVEAKTVVLDARETASEAENHAAVGNVIEQRDLLCHADRIVPRQHDHARSELYVRGAASHVGEELQHVGAHRVVVEVMLDAPDGIEAKLLDHLGEAQLVAINLGIGKCVVGILEYCAISNVHDESLLAESPSLLTVIDRPSTEVQDFSCFKRCGGVTIGFFQPCDHAQMLRCA